MGELANHVHAFRPESEGEELEIREALLIARSFACDLRWQVGSPLACDLAGLADELAGGWVYAPAPANVLEKVRDCCRHIVQAARLIEWIERAAGQ